MPGQKWTPERKKAASEATKARHAAAKNKNPETKEDDSMGMMFPPIVGAAELKDPMFGPQPGQTPDMQSPDQGDIQRMVNEMVEARLAQMMPQTPSPGYNPWAASQNGLHVGASGSLVGTRDKFILDPKRYPDPRTRLADEPKLQRFAFKENYDMDWGVTVTQYQTKDGVNTREPKFTLKLRRIMFDDDTGLPTDNRYVVCQAIFHEDPEAALVIAHDNGYEVSEYSERDFLDEMRYLRLRDWLLEAFYPPKPQATSKKKEMVIGNRVVEVFTINGEGSQSIPFGQLAQNKKL